MPIQSEQYNIEEFEIPKPVDLEKHRYQPLNVEVPAKP
jgi:hypothetical protein